MQSFRCHCGSQVFFDNTRCVTCSRELAFMPWMGEMTTIVSALPEGFEALVDGMVYRKCGNYFEEGVCNWLLPRGEEGSLCQACSLNRIVPDLSEPENRTLWATMEAAKRRLLYSLNRLSLPLDATLRSDLRLRFDIKEDTPSERATTGHSNGLI
ncbi:MAG: putative zinc-binding metallopeptidase, partial [Polyangiales bacterium]